MPTVCASSLPGTTKAPIFIVRTTGLTSLTAKAIAALFLYVQRNSGSLSLQPYQRNLSESGEVKSPPVPNAQAGKRSGRSSLSAPLGEYRSPVFRSTILSEQPDNSSGARLDASGTTARGAITILR